jgi:hypothetical protein
MFHVNLPCVSSLVSSATKPCLHALRSIFLQKNSTLTKFHFSLPDGLKGAGGVAALLNMKIDRKRNNLPELDITLDYTPQSFNERKLFNSLISSSSSNGSSSARCKFLCMWVGSLFVAPMLLPMWWASVSRLIFAGGSEFKSVFADVVGYFSEDSRNEDLNEKGVYFHAVSSICCCSLLLWAPLVAVYVTISSAHDLQTAANWSLFGILFLTCAIVAKILHLYCKDPSSQKFGSNFSNYFGNCYDISLFCVWFRFGFILVCRFVFQHFGNTLQHLHVSSW